MVVLLRHLRWREVFVNLTLFLSFFDSGGRFKHNDECFGRKNLFVGYGFGPHRQNSITHLQFADDTRLVGEKSWANILALKAVLILFEVVFGLKVNFHKSVIVGVNINDSWLHEAALFFNCKHSRLPFLYLELSIGVGNQSKECQSKGNK